MKKVLAVLTVVCAMLAMSAVVALAHVSTQTRWFYWDGSSSPISVCDTQWPGSDFVTVQGNYVQCKMITTTTTTSTSYLYQTISWNPNIESPWFVCEKVLGIGWNTISVNEKAKTVTCRKAVTTTVTSVALTESQASGSGATASFGLVFVGLLGATYLVTQKKQTA